MKSLSLRLVPRSLTGRLVVLLLLALTASHAASFIILHDERRDALQLAAREQAVDRLAAVIRLLEETPANLHSGVLRAASTPRLRFRLVAETRLPPGTALSGPARFAQEVLSRRLDLPPDDIRVDFQDDWRRPWRHGHNGEPGEPGDYEDDDEEGEEDWWEQRPWGDRSWGDRDGSRRTILGSGMVAAIRLSDGSWVESVSVLDREDKPWAIPALISLGLSAFTIVLIVTVMIRRTMRPVRQLAEAVERVGRGESRDPVLETGPEDIRLLIRSFNTMRDRLDRYVRDRMTMLAAMSHDLRTPITALRLRAELLEDGDDKSHFLATLDELQQMAGEVLSFIRAEARQEETRRVDLGALIDSVADDLRATGESVTFDAPAEGRVLLDCRPNSLKRALRNILENATRYGERATIAFSLNEGAARIVVTDDGPGIPADQMDRLFEPFVRLDTSRSRDTGGVGLGLSIARSVVLSHGGEIRLQNRPEGGLEATITLPATSPRD